MQAFWQDFFGKMGGMQPGPDAMYRMRKAFMDSMSKWAEEYMRSEAFLRARGVAALKASLVDHLDDIVHSQDAPCHT